MPGNYSKSVSTVVSTFEENSISLSSTTSTVKKQTYIRQLGLYPVLKLKHDSPRWTSDTENVFKTPGSSLLAKAKQNTGIVWEQKFGGKQTRTTTDFSDLDNALSTSPSAKGSRSSMQIYLHNISAQPGYLPKNKLGAIRKVPNVKRAGKGKMSKHKNTKLTAAKVLLRDLTTIKNGTNISTNRIMKGTSVKQMRKLKPASRKNSPTNNIAINSPVRVARNNYSSITVESGSKGKQINRAKFSHIHKKGLKSVSKTLKPNATKKAKLGHNIVSENIIPPVASPRKKSPKKTKPQLKTFGNNQTPANASPIVEKVLKTRMKKGKNSKQIKARSLRKDNVIVKGNIKQINVLSSSKALKLAKVVGRIDTMNSDGASAVSLQVQKSEGIKNKAGTLAIPQLKKSKTRRHGIRYVAKASAANKAAKKAIKTTRHSMTENSQTLVPSNIQSSESVKMQTVPAVKSVKKKAGLLAVKLVDYSVAGADEILDFIGIDDLQTKIKKSDAKSGKCPKKASQLLMNKNKRKPGHKSLANTKLLSPEKYSAKSGSSKNLNNSARVLKNTKVVDEHFDGLETSVSSWRNVRNETQLSPIQKQRKISNLARSGTKRILRSKNKNAPSPAGKKYHTSLTVRKKEKKNVGDGKKIAFGTGEIPVKMYESPQTDSQQSKTPARISPSPSRKKMLKKSPPTRKQKSPSHLIITNAKKYVARKRKPLSSESPPHKISNRSLQLEKQDSPMLTSKITLKQSAAKKSTTASQILVSKLKKDHLKTLSKIEAERHHIKSVPVEIAESISRALQKRPQTNTITLSPSKRPRISDSPVLRKQQKQVTTGKQKSSLHIVKETTRKRSNKKRQSSTTESLPNKLYNRSLQSEKQTTPGINSKQSVVKKSQKSTTSLKPVPKILLRRKQVKLLNLKKGAKEVSSFRPRKSSSFTPTSASDIYHQFIASINSGSDVSESLSVPVTNQISSSLIRKTVNKPLKKQNKSQTPKKKTCRLSVALKMKKILSPAKSTFSGLSPNSSEIEFGQTEKLVNVKKEFKSSPTGLQTSRLHYTKVTPKQSVVRRSRKFNSGSVSQKESNRSLPENNELKNTKRNTPKLSVSKFSEKSNESSPTSIPAKMQTKLLQSNKRVKKIGAIEQEKPSSRPSVAIGTVSSHSFVKINKRSTVSESSSHVPVLASVVVKRTPTSLARKGVNKLPSVTRQNKSLTPAKKKTRRLYGKTIKGKKSLPATNKVTELSSSNVEEHFGQRKNKYISVVYKTSPKQSSRKKKSGLTSPKKIELSPNKFLVKINPLKTFRLRKSTLSLSATSIKDTHERDQKKLEISRTPWKNQTDQATPDNMLTNKNTAKLSTKVKQRKLLLTPKGARKAKTTQIEEISSLFPEDKTVSKHQRGKRSQNTVSNASSNKANFAKKKKIAKLTPRKISQKKNLKVPAKIDAKKSHPLKSRELRPKSSHIMISPVSPQQNQSAKLLLGRKLLQKTTSSSLLNKLDRRPKRSIRIGSVEGTSDDLFNRRNKMYAHDTSFGIVQPSWSNTSSSPVNLLMKYTNNRMESPVSMKSKAAELSPRMSDLHYTGQTKLTKKVVETSHAGEEIISSGLGRKALSSSSHIVDNYCPQREENSSPQWSVTTPSSSLGMPVSSYTGRGRIIQSPAVAKTETHITKISYTRKERTAPSLVDKAAVSLEPWTKDVKFTEHQGNVSASETPAGSLVSLADSYRRYTMNAPYLSQTRPTSSTLLDYTESYDKDKKSSNIQPSSSGTSHQTTDLKSVELVRNSCITSSSHRENVADTDHYREERFGFQAEQESDVSEDVDKSEEFEESEQLKGHDKLKRSRDEDTYMTSEDRYDVDTAMSHSTHSQRCTVS